VNGAVPTQTHSATKVPIVTRLLTLHDPAEARHYYATGAWQGDTLYALTARWAAIRGDRPAVRDPYRRLDWAALKSEADGIAGALHETGLRAGDRVSVCTGNRVEAVAIFLACSRNGYVYNTSLHQNYTVGEICGLLERVSCRALFAQRGYGADGALVDIFEQAAKLPTKLALFEASNHNLPAYGAQPAPVSDPDKIVYLAFTSGTTGAPKGVMHSDNSLLANARAMVSDWGHDGDTVLLTFSQMSHHIGTVALCQALVGGFELVLSDAAAGISPINWIEQTGATYVMGVPTHAIDILAAHAARGGGSLGQVKTFYLAGAPIPAATATALLSLGITPQNVYGMTENGSHNYTRPDDPLDAITGTCGKPCAAYEIAIFSQDNRDVPVAAGEVGEIGGRGGMRMLGYFANQDATEAAINDDGWFMSGDLGRIDARGDLEIVGRAKDIIIRGGHNIHPARIEDLAMRHPDVQKAAAVAMPDERLGERVCLVVTASPGAEPDGDVVLAHLHAAGLSKFDMPEYFACIEALPLGPTGKILKRELATLVRSGSIVTLPVHWTPAAQEAMA
jgi:acyl-CoA synthetase